MAELMVSCGWSPGVGLTLHDPWSLGCGRFKKIMLLDILCTSCVSTLPPVDSAQSAAGPWLTDPTVQAANPVQRVYPGALFEGCVHLHVRSPTLLHAEPHVRFVGRSRLRTRVPVARIVARGLDQPLEQVHDALVLVQKTRLLRPSPDFNFTTILVSHERCTKSMMCLMDHLQAISGGLLSRLVRK